MPESDPSARSPVRSRKALQDSMVCVKATTLGTMSSDAHPAGDKKLPSHSHLGRWQLSVVVIHCFGCKNVFMYHYRHPLLQ